MKWDPEQTQTDLTISADGLTLSWQNEVQAAWLASQSTARLHSGIYAWDFEIEELADRQIGVGIMLNPPDWGFFRYLGAGKNAWAYDAYKGAIVTETKAIHSELPKISDKGKVSVRLDLLHKYTCVFTVKGMATPAITLPRGCVVIPAACLLKRGQAVRIASFKQIE
jgi:hypothetical protein